MNNMQQRDDYDEFYSFISNFNQDNVTTASDSNTHKRLRHEDDSQRELYNFSSC